MALQRDTFYPGRWSPATPAHPQGAFKNRTAPGSLDGSYIEQSWANDWDGYFSTMLAVAGITPNNFVDEVGASQYYTALVAVIKGQATGRLLRDSIYTNVGGILKVSINGAAPVNAPGTFTPFVGAVNALAEAVAGGGGGGGCNGTGVGQVAAAGGGGGGGYTSGWLPAASLSGVVLAVGAGGPSAALSAGGAGSSSSIGAIMSATGGAGGTLGVAVATPTFTSLSGGSVGGVGSNGNLINSQGGLGNYGAQAATPISGAGGGSVIGFGASFVSGTANGMAAISLGSGGSGGSLLASVGGGAAGGVGAAGMIRIREYS